MKKLRLLGVFCACVLPFVFGNIGNAATLYQYTGNAFDSTGAPCTIGADGCFNITATIELSTALGNDQPLQPVTPDAWSISDGLTTITDQTPDYSVFNTLNLGTDMGGNIDQWFFTVFYDGTTPQLLGDLQSMRTTLGAGAGTADDTHYCTASNSCTPSQFILNGNPGTWMMTTVPLPASVWLLGTGLVGLLGVARRRKAA